MKKLKGFFKNIDIRILKWIGIVFLLFLFLVPTYFVNTIAGYIGLLFFVSVILVSLCLMLILQRSISIESNVQYAKCWRGDMREVGLIINNKSRIISPKAVTSFYMKDFLGEIVVEKELVLAIGAKARNDFKLMAPMKHVGEYRVGLTNLILYDMSGLFKKKVDLNGDYVINVVPKIKDMQNLIEDIEADNIEHDSSVAIPGGTDYVGVREYERGDSMKMIHWKLSARSPEYMTKLTESSMRSSYVVMAEFAAPDYDRETLLDLNDCIVETSLSIAVHLSHEDVMYSMMYADRNHIIKREVPDEEQVERIAGDFERISSSDPDSVRAEALIAEENDLGLQSSNLILCTSNLSGDTMQALIDVKRQRRVAEAFFVIPKDLNSREREKVLAPLASLDEAGVRYHIISTKVNEIDTVSYENIS